VTAVIVIAVVFVAFGLAAIGAWLSERSPSSRPLYDWDELLPPPNVRSQRSGRESH
jgi:hypothetical protein